jgi:hypothetical protein
MLRSCIVKPVEQVCIGYRSWCTKKPKSIATQFTYALDAAIPHLRYRKRPFRGSPDKPVGPVLLLLLHEKGLFTKVLFLESGRYRLFVEAPVDRIQYHLQNTKNRQPEKILTGWSVYPPSLDCLDCAGDEKKEL